MSRSAAGGFPSFDGPAAAASGRDTKRPRDGHAVEQALLSAMHGLTSSDEADLPGILRRLGEALDASRLTLYVLVEDQESDAPPLGAPLDGVDQKAPSPPATGIATEARSEPQSGVQTSIHLAPASEQDELLEKVLRAHSAGWLLPVVSPRQRLHGYLDVQPSRGDGEDLDRAAGRALQYLCSLLAGYFDRWSEQNSPERAAQANPSTDDAPAASDERVAEALKEQQDFISRELHDNVGQLLTSIRMMSENLAASRGRDGLSTQQEQVRRITELAGEAAVHVSQFRQQLGASFPEAALAPARLVPALDELCSRMNAGAGAHCSFECPDGSEAASHLDEKARLQLYRIAQEAANNAAKYADAQHIRIVLALEEEQQPVLVLRVRDDGRGFDPAKSAEDGSGLRNMTSRAQAIGGRLQIDAAPGEGTTVTCELPMPASKEPPASS